MEIGFCIDSSINLILSMKIFAVIALFACSGSAMAQVADKPTQNQTDTLGLTFLNTVKKGETLYKIAKMYKMTVPQLTALNPEVKVLSPGINIHVVRKSVKPVSSPNAITVPTQNLDVHVVEKGETLYSIAKKYNTTIDILRKINNFGDANLSLGQSIQVPVVNPLKGVKSPAPTKPKVETPTEKEKEPINVPQKNEGVNDGNKPKAVEVTTTPEKKTPKETAVRVDQNKGRDQGGMPEKLVKPNVEIGMKENERKGVLTLATDQYGAEGNEDRAWVYFDDAAENEVVALINTKNNKFIWCVVKGKNKNASSAVSVSKFVADKLGIFDEKTVVRVKYAVAK